MYRFNKADNERARHFFEMAVRLDPTFARAYAGLSFTHFQNAFQGWAKREPEIERAFEAAGQSLMVDDRDPAAHWAMGRALWLRGRQDQSVVELERAIDLSPNFALGHYTLAFVHSQARRPAAPPSRSSDHSRQLEPVRPAAVRHARRARHGARAPRAVRGSRRVGRQGRGPPERARAHPGDRRLLPGAGRIGSTRRAPCSPRSARTLPALPRRRFPQPPSGSSPTARRCSARPPSASAWIKRALALGPDARTAAANARAAAPAGSAPGTGRGGLTIAATIASLGVWPAARLGAMRAPRYRCGGAGLPARPLAAAPSLLSWRHGEPSIRERNIHAARPCQASASST